MAPRNFLRVGEGIEARRKAGKKPELPKLDHNSGGGGAGPDAGASRVLERGLQPLPGRLVKAAKFLRLKVWAQCKALTPRVRRESKRLCVCQSVQPAVSAYQQLPCVWRAIHIDKRKPLHKECSIRPRAFVARGYGRWSTFLFCLVSCTPRRSKNMLFLYIVAPCLRP